jgi:hypothetical protein
VRRQSTDSSHFDLKVAIRREAVADLETVNVLDCFGGENRIWSKIPHQRYYGVDRQAWKGANLTADNRRVLNTLDLSGFNVIDLDAYGMPDTQIATLLKNPTLQPQTVVVLTCITGAMNGLSKHLVDYFHLRAIWDKTKTVVHKRGQELFMGWLFDMGVEQLRGELVTDSSGMHKLYGYFRFPETAQVRRQHERHRRRS